MALRNGFCVSTRNAADLKPTADIGTVYALFNGSVVQTRDTANLITVDFPIFRSIVIAVFCLKFAGNQSRIDFAA